MPRGADLDLEIVDLGNAYTIYAASLLVLAAAMNRNGEVDEAREKVQESSQLLSEGITRCRLREIKIPQNFSSDEEIMQTLISGQIGKRVANQLVRTHSQRQELIFLFIVMVGGLMTGQVRGISDELESLRSEISRIGDQLHLPRRLIQKCLESPGHCFEEIRIYIERSGNRDRVRKILSWMRQNTIIAIFIVIGIIIIALGTFTNAIYKIYSYIMAPLLQ